ncbi:MAG: hypothetical protein IT310_07120 [Anaerolineales bacterium]|nr:hypothetical protein [Anaerolineales bacterium]
MDQRHKLQAQPFAFQKTKTGKVFLDWRGKQVLMLKAKKAESFLRHIAYANEEQVQLLMAKMTGNFKRGNER